MSDRPSAMPMKGSSPSCMSAMLMTGFSPMRVAESDPDPELR